MLKVHIFKQHKKNQQAHTTETHIEPTRESCSWFCLVLWNHMLLCPLQDWSTVRAARSSHSHSGRTGERRWAVPGTARAHLLHCSWEKRKDSINSPWGFTDTTLKGFPASCCLAVSCDGFTINTMEKWKSIDYKLPVVTSTHFRGSTLGVMLFSLFKAL